MISIVLSIIIFLMLFIFHIIFSRYYIDSKYDFKKITFFIFFLGLIVYLLIHIIIKIHDGYIYSGAVLYIFTILLHSIFFTNPYLKDRSPSSEILRYLSKKDTMTKKEILELFNNEDLVKKRINDLVKSGYIVSHKNRYIATKSGLRLSDLFAYYAKIMKWEKGG